MTDPVNARDALDLVAATVCAGASVVHGVLVEDLVDDHAPTRGVIFSEHVVQITGTT